MKGPPIRKSVTALSQAKLWTLVNLKIWKYDENGIIVDQCECQIPFDINAADESDHTWCSVSLFVHITTSDVISHSLSGDVDYINDDHGGANIYSLFEHEIHITRKFWEKLLVFSYC